MPLFSLHFISLPTEFGAVWRGVMFLCVCAGRVRGGWRALVGAVQGGVKNANAWFGIPAVNHTVLCNSPAAKSPA